MKKLFVVFIAILLTASLYAQDVTRQDRGNRHERGNRQERNNTQELQNRQRQIDPLTIDGVLTLQRGIIAVQSGNITYVVPILNRYIGFISDLKEGARVSIEGFGFRNFIQPIKVTINGKTYDFGNRTQLDRLQFGFMNFRRNMHDRDKCACNCGRTGTRAGRAR